MIECIINGVSTYPDTSSSIKVTYENPYVKDSGSYTYEISFPMRVTANFKFFSGISRFEVSKKREAYEDCKLIFDNREVISGKGTIKSITNDVVKLQIVGGASRIKYNSKWEKHFIDEIDYDDAVIIHGLDSGSVYGGYSQPIETVGGGRIPYVAVDLSKSEIAGHSEMFCLSPIMDETNNIIANRIFRNHNSNLEPLVHMDSDDSVELKISPAAMYERKVVEETDDNKRLYTNDDFKDKLVIIPSADNTRESGLADMSVDDTGEYYVSVKDAMEGTSVEEESAGDESVMNVFFTGKNVRYLYDGKTYSINTSMDKGNWWWPITFTDTEIYNKPSKCFVSSFTLRSRHSRYRFVTDISEWRACSLATTMP